MNLFKIFTSVLLFLIFHSIGKTQSTDDLPVKEDYYQIGEFFRTMEIAEIGCRIK